METRLPARRRCRGGYRITLKAGPEGARNAERIYQPHAKWKYFSHHRHGGITNERVTFGRATRPPARDGTEPGTGMSRVAGMMGYGFARRNPRGQPTATLQA